MNISSMLKKVFKNVFPGLIRNQEPPNFFQTVPELFKLEDKLIFKCNDFEDTEFIIQFEHFI
jgi:hypothetical protein